MGALPLALAKSIYYSINTVKGLNPGVITFQLILAVSNVTTTVAPLTHRWQCRKKTNCLLHFRVVNLKNFYMNPAVVGSQEQS